MLDHVPTISEFERAAGAERRRRLVAALNHVGMSQTDLVRRLNLAGERTAPTTVNRWYLGKSVMSEGMLRYVLALLELPPDWQPPTSTTPTA
jgi:hypothetical protein